jgi:signal transduction histidine kinase
MDFLHQIFNPHDFMPHGHCYLWTPSLVWLNVISDSLIGLAYLAIPISLFDLIRRRRDIGFHWMFIAFGIFITACGATHFLEVWNVWHAAYWLAGGVKAVTALASLTTAVLLARLVPVALTIPSPAQLQVVNDQLRSEIAERAHAEEEIKALNAKLQHRNGQLEAANKELEAFSYSVSHDLRAPLRGINGFSQMLLQDYADRVDDQGKDYLRRIGAASKRMGQLIDGLLNFSRLSRAQLRHEPINLSALARSIGMELHEREPHRQVDLHVADGLVAEGDPDLVRSVFDNLLGNAWKFTSKRPHAVVEFGYNHDNGPSAFFVRDNGVGFDMTDATKLFGAFQRLHAPDEFPGTGVGLATVQRVIYRHGGRVWAEAEVNKGATFYFTLS